MDHSHPKFIQYMKNRNPANPLLLKVFEEMSKGGHLDGLSDDMALEKAVSVTERLMKIPTPSQ